MPSPMATEAPKVADAALLTPVSTNGVAVAAVAGVQVVQEAVEKVKGEGGSVEVPAAATCASTAQSEEAAPTTPGSSVEQSTDLEEMIFQVAKAINIDLGAPNPRSQFRKKLAAKSFTKKSPEGLVLHSKQMAYSSDSLAPSVAKRAVERAIKATPVTTREPRAATPSKAASPKATAPKATSPKAAPTKAVAAKAKFDRPIKTVPSLSKKTPDPILWEGPPDEPFPAGGNWPEGWLKRVCKRTSGATAGQTDKYWITPGVKQRLRSIMEIRKWMKAMQVSNGDETEARKLYKKIVV